MSAAVTVSSAGGYLLAPILMGLALQTANPQQFPVGRLVRNMFLGPIPEKLQPKYAKCQNKDTMFDGLADDVTIVVSVKDSCSQAPGFIKGLERMAPPGVRLVYTYPNFTSCSELDYSASVKRWDNPILWPLDPHVSPMQGWLDVAKTVTTPYTYLVHNDGYALDPYFLCELVEALKARKAEHTGDGPHFAIAAPMLYESKHDGSYAAHATQSNLRLVNEADGEIVRHDHSLEMALRRQGVDLVEGEQVNFLEDHGFLIESDKTATVIDPHASFTMEYLDMIMTIKSNAWKVLLVPTARLEFRITEFSWRDIPYFMYKRSEITAHGTRDYLAAKWKVMFPNTGFWTFIKYTIVERHSYQMNPCPADADKRECEVLPADLSWEHQALLAVGFFQMTGWNRYQLNETGAPLGFLDVMDAIERDGWKPSTAVQMTRETVRPDWTVECKTEAPEYGERCMRPLKHGTRTVQKVLHPDCFGEEDCYGQNAFPKIEADLTLEYYPFSAAELKVKSCDQLTSDGALPVCGLVLDNGDSCSCWINLQTFKNGGIFPSIIDYIAGLIKIPSRISTYWEMTTMDTKPGNLEKHTARLERFNAMKDVSKGAFRMFKCKQTDLGDGACKAEFELTAQSKVKQFLGRPFNPTEVARALDLHFAAL
jgi:hypothetical protein